MSQPAAKGRRVKVWATVAPERLAPTLHEKLDAATRKLDELRRAEEPRLTLDLDPRTILRHFLTSARGVYLTAETFANSRLNFKTWLRSWEQANQTELALWDCMRDQRDAETHGDGPALIELTILMPPVYEHHHNAVLLGVRPHRPGSGKGGIRFAAYDDVPASEVCAKYLTLCRQFSEEFLRDHAALI